MTEFHAGLHERAEEALTALAQARATGDDYSVDIHTEELDSLLRLADEHGVRLPELDGWRRHHAAERHPLGPHHAVRRPQPSQGGEGAVHGGVCPRR